MRDVLPVEELVLVDPDRDRLELVGAFGRRILDRMGHPATLTTTTELAPALDGVDAVLLQLRVGGQAARNQDETWPLECGCVGQETTGAGGLAKALRTVPVVLDIAEQVAAAAPDAWIIDFTNPVGIVTRALLQAGHRAVGLCNVAIGFQRRFADYLGVEPDRVQLDHVGLNHLTWERAARVDGVDRLPEILAATRRRPGGGHRAAGEPADARSASCRRTTCATSTPTTRWCASCSDSESRASQVTAIEHELLRLYEDPTLDASRRCSSSGAVRTTPRRRSSWRRRCSAAPRPRRPRSSTCATTAPCRSSPTTRSSRCPPRSTVPASGPAGRAAGAVVRRTRRPRHGVRAPGARGCAPRRLRAGVPGPAGASSRRPGRPRHGSRRPAGRPQPRLPAVGLT